MSAQVTIYMNDKDKEKAEKLLQIMSEEGVKLTDNRGNLSKSALFRELVRAGLRERGICKDDTPKN